MTIKEKAEQKPDASRHMQGNRVKKCVTKG
jgi:hypothetical protein